MSIKGALNYEDFRLLARRRLPRGLFEYLDRGAEDEVGIAAGRAAWDRIKLMPDVLVDASLRETKCELFGRTIAAPIVIAPTALAGLLWRDGETELARAAAAAGIPFTVATQSAIPIERIASAKAWLWLQLYVWRNRELTWKFLERGRAAGADVLVLTVDTCVAPKREYNIRSGFGVPFQPSLTATLDVLCRPRWLASVLMRHLLAEGIPTYAHYPPEFRTRIGREAINEDMRLDERLDWPFVKELRQRWSGPLILKGILGVQDAHKAVEHGCDGIVVSTHGARNLDSAVATADALGPIADAVGHKLVVLADSGIRRGSDIVKALALGARAVMVGRATLYGTAVAGEAGAKAILDILVDELTRVMGYVGRSSVTDLDRSLIAGTVGSP